MAKSAPLVLLMVFLTLTATFSPLSHNSSTSAVQSEVQAALASPSDPSVRNIAFNVTLAQFDLYTNRTAAIQPANVTPGILTWFNSTIDGRQVNGTRFTYEIPAGQPIDQNVTWTMGIPRGAYAGSTSNHTFLRFQWNGTVTSGTSARYIIHNNTHVIRTIVHNSTFASGQSPSSLPCFPNEECFDVTGFIGKTLNLVLRFNSTSAGGGLKVEASYVAVASVSRQFENPATDTHTMDVDVDPTRIIHNANSTIPVYNTTATQPVHVWNSTAVIFRFPLAYTLTDIKMNGTTSLDLTRTLDNGTCSTVCGNRLPIGNTTVSGTSFISFNLTSVYAYAIAASVPAVIAAVSPNAVENIETALGGVATDFWVPGDLVGVRMRIQPSLNISGAQNVSLTPPTGPTPPGLDQLFNNRGGTYLYNITLPTTAVLGLWTVQGTFLNGYDFGFLTRSFRVEQINTNSLTMTGEAGQGKALTVQGTFTYGNSSVASGVNATVFAVDTGSPPGAVFSQYSGSPLPGLYVSNITLANGVFNENQPLRVLFTVMNPTLSTAFSANVTIQHEWARQGGSHGASVTFPLTLGDEPFNLSPSSTYQMDVSLTSGGVKVSLKSLTRTSVTVTHTLTAGSSAVSPFRQHFGLFNIAVTSKPFAGGTPNTNFLRSPTYAYVMTGSSVTPSRLLESTPTVMSLPSGGFTATLSADKLLGAKRLVLFVLTRDVTGVVTGLGQVKTVSDSTILTATTSIPAELTIRQSVTVSLSLRSSSTALPITLTVNLDVSGSTAFGTKTVTIQPESTVPIDFTITAPDAAGSYLLTFSSPQYGVLATKELKVGLLQSSLQVLIPAIIGLVSALVILGLYLVRKRGGMEIEEEEKKRPAPGRPSKTTQGSSGQKSLTRS